MGNWALRETKTDETGHFEKTNWELGTEQNKKTRLVVVVGNPPQGSDADLLGFGW